MNHSFDERQRVGDIFQTNISAAKQTFNYCNSSGYRNFCALSTIAFTHPGVPLDTLLQHINTMSGDDHGFTVSNTYQIALRLRTLNGQVVSHEECKKNDLNDDLFRYICRDNVRSVWFSISRPREDGHLFGAIPLTDDSYCVWDTASSNDLDSKWSVLSTSEIVERLIFYHTAYKK